MPRELCTRCGTREAQTREAQTKDQRGFTLPHPQAAGPFGPPGLTCLKRHRALSMRFPPLRPDRQATCALPGWMHATVLYGMSTTAVPPMAARPGQASPSSPATWRVTATFNPMALVFRSEIILKWTLIAAATHRSFGVKG